MLILSCNMPLSSAPWDRDDLDSSFEVKSAWKWRECTSWKDSIIESLNVVSVVNMKQWSTWFGGHCLNYRKTSNIRRTLVGNKIVDHSDVVSASPVGAAPTTSSFSTWHLASRDSAKTVARQSENLLSVGIWCVLYYKLDGTYFVHGVDISDMAL